MVGLEKALGAVKMIKDQIQYRSQSLLNLACGYCKTLREHCIFTLLLGIVACLSIFQIYLLFIGISNKLVHILTFDFCQEK